MSGSLLQIAALSLVLLAAVFWPLERLWPARAGFAALPAPVRLLVVVALADLGVYGFHRACHAWGPLWRIHSVHHSAEHLDWLAAHREHPLDGLLTQLVVNLPAMLLGVGLEGIATSTPMSACRWGRCGCCSARRTSTTGTT